MIRDLAEHDEMAMVLVTHEMDFALEIADRVLFLDDGGHCRIRYRGKKSSTNLKIQDFRTS
ncbi:hypothetical protein ACFPFV_12660 [Salinicoccus siamensis]|uniref:hypothetical protein n=1 Tax=Salinicoccus siamensis TaxID=381830 RepID=UPI003611910F